jgi:hypothetical protein
MLAQRADAVEAILEPDASTQTNVDFYTDINEPADLCYDELEDTTQEPARKKQKMNLVHKPSPEGTMRIRMRDLLEMVTYVAYVPGWYAAHIAPGKW